MRKNSIRASPEATIQREILLSVGQRADCRVWRMNTAAIEFGGVTRDDCLKMLQLLEAGASQERLKEIVRGWLNRPTRLVRAGFKGQADIGGVLTVTIDGRRVGVRLEIEVKSKTGRQTAEQKTYQRIVETAGGVYVLAKSADEANQKIDSAKRGMERGAWLDKACEG